MLIAVLSDIHDRVSHLDPILRKLAVAKPDALICCGDITRQETLFTLAQFPAPLHACLGNCDLAHTQPLLRSAKMWNVSLSLSLGLLALPNGETAAFTHFPEQALEIANTCQHKAVFYGHTHKAKIDHIYIEDKNILLANPGDIQGRYADPRALVWDTETQKISWVMM
jgi:putative phosphoesterase